MRRMMAMTLAGMIGLVGLTGCPPEDEQQQDTQPPQQQPDQTQPQQDQTQPQPDQQDEPLGRARMSDEQLAQQIEDQIQQQTQLSEQGRDVSLSVEDGQVTLEGYVQSEQESQQIEQIATEVAGQQNVDNQLEIRDQSNQQQQQQNQQQQLQDDQFDQQP